MRLDCLIVLVEPLRFGVVLAMRVACDGFGRFFWKIYVLVNVPFFSVLGVFV